MSVWPVVESSGASLLSPEGTLVSISIHVDPRNLESLLEALAQVDFPINPQIYHDGAIVYRYADDREETEATTLVEFPAYAERMEEVRRALAAHGFDPAMAHATSMLDEIHAECLPEKAPPGAAYQSIYRLKHRSAGAR